MKAKAASNKNAAKEAQETAVNLDVLPEDDELEAMSSEFGGDKKMLSLLLVMSKPKYFDTINDVLNTALKAVGVEMNGCNKNFAKLYCISLAYPVRYFWSKERLQQSVTTDILRMITGPKEELHEILRHFSGFSDLIDPDETGMLNVSDERFKEFMTA